MRPELGPCWLWIGGRDENGYGRVVDLTKKALYQYAHRVSFEMENGLLQPGENVLHACDNPPCVRPDHLSRGSQLENMADRDAKGRVASGDRHGWNVHPELRPKGESIGTHKLTAHQVEQIRAARATGTFSQAELATLYGVSQSAISNIVTGKRWGHL